MGVAAATLLPTQRARIGGVSWPITQANPTGTPIEMSAWQDRTVHMFGTWDSGTIVMQGSNDPRANPAHASHASAVWSSLRDPGGTVISFTADALSLKAILELPRWIRPSSSGGGASHAVTVIINARGDTN